MSTSKVAQNTSYLMAAFIGQKLLSFVYFTIVSLMVGPTLSGRYFIATSFTTIFSIFIDLGLANVLVREIAKNQERARELLGNALSIKAALTAVTVVVAIVVAGLLGYPREVFLMICAATIVMTLDGIHLVFYAVMRGEQNLRYEALGVISGQIITIAVGLSFMTAGFPLVFLIVALMCGSAWNVLWSLWMLRRKFFVLPTFQWNRNVVDFLWKASAPFALAGIFSRIYSYVDSVMLSKLVSESAVGLYGVASKIAFAFQFVPMALAAAVYPAMSAYHREDRTKLPGLYSSALMYLFMLSLPIAVGIGTLAEPLLHLVFDERYIGAAAPLRILMGSLVFAFLYWPAGSLLNACDRQARNTTVMGVTMVTNVLLNIILIPRFGVVGAATSALVGNAVLFFGAFISARDLAPFNLKPELWRAARIALSALLMGICAWQLIQYLAVFFVVPIAAAVYGISLIVFRVVTKEDWVAAKALFKRNPKPEATTV